MHSLMRYVLFSLLMTLALVSGPLRAAELPQDLEGRRRVAAADLRLASSWLAYCYQIPPRVPQEMLLAGYNYSDTLVAQQDQGMAMISAKTPDARAAVEKQVQEGVAEQKRKIREFLNDEADFQAYEAYAGTLSERQQLLGLKPVLEAGGNPLTGDQEERLVEAMHRARTTSMPAAEWGDGSVPGEAVFADDAAERLDRALTKMNESVLNETASILDENQQKAFADYQEQMKNMQKTGIEMARTMFQAKPAENK